MGDVFDLSQFQLPTKSASIPSVPSITTPTTRTMPIDQIKGEEFLAGPIRMGWIEAAARLPGAALQVALLVLHLHVMRGRDWIVLSNVAAKKLGVSSSAKSRALVELEAAGLVEIQIRKPGCAPRVKPVGDKYTPPTTKPIQHG